VPQLKIILQLDAVPLHVSRDCLSIHFAGRRYEEDKLRLPLLSRSFGLLSLGLCETADGLKARMTAAIACYTQSTLQLVWRQADCGWDVAELRWQLSHLRVK
jgi:hypothetical protein